MTTITSLQNPRVKDAVRLRDRRHREKQGRILIDGARELSRAISSGVKLIETFVCPPLCTGEEARRVLELLPKTGCETLEASEAVFAKLAFGDRSEGILGVAETPRVSLSSLIKPRPPVAPAPSSITVEAAVELPPQHSGATGGRGFMGRRHSGATDGRGFLGRRGANMDVPLVAVLEGVEKPGNLGAVLRSADAAGVSALVAADPRTDLYNPNAIRASLGTIFTVPVCEATSRDTLDWLRVNGFRIFAARVDGAIPYSEADYRGRSAVVLGNEAEGLSSLWQGDDIQAVRLPMLGAADSLNVSAAAAVLFYEALRQRRG